jgi:peptide-methionine (S)-S-oxide reductase
MRTRHGVVTPYILLLAAVLLLATVQPLFSQQMEVATFAAGCFWSIETIYDKLDGVVSAESGYAGGTKDNPTADDLDKGKYGYAEVVRVTFDPTVVSYNKLLEIFWLAHDPTTLNRQGDDVGRKYRSMILYHNDDQKKWATESMKSASSSFDDPIVTEIVPLTGFYAASEHNQDFYENNKNSGYCRSVINPKLRKMKKLGAYD